MPYWPDPKGKPGNLPDMISIEDHDPRWARQFESLRARFLSVLAGHDVDIQHIGSTAVPGLAAKPILDIDVIVPKGGDIPAVIACLCTLGYQHVGDLGVPERESLREISPTEGPRHHLYVCREGALSLRNHLLLRDYLRQHPDAAHEYATLKRGLAAGFPHDIDVYCSGKSEFITDILGRCGMTPEEQESIRSINGS